VPGGRHVCHAGEYGGPSRAAEELLQADDIPFRVATFCVAGRGGHARSERKEDERAS
jgi:hypothetical protein